MDSWQQQAVSEREPSAQDDILTRLPLSPPHLYGRDEESAALLAAWQAAAAGQGRLALVAGEAGIGKTSLVDVVVAAAQADGATILAGHCYDLETGRLYQPWLELLRFADAQGIMPNGRSHTDLLAGVTGTDAHLERFSAFLTALTAEKPVLLLLEDLHWSDQATLDLLRALARRLSAWRVLVIVTFRDNELTPHQPLHRVLPVLVREVRPLRFDLRPLRIEAVQRLTADRYRLPPDDEARLVQHLMQFSEGNPFYLEELLRTLEHEQIVQPNCAGWKVANLTKAQVPPLVRQLIDDRVARLGPSTQRILQIAAVIGQIMPLDLWQTASEADDDVFADAVEQARMANLIEETPDQTALRFCHALFRAAIYDGVALPRRRNWHRRVADLLAERPAPELDIVAHHLLQASDHRAVSWLIRAGHRAERQDAARDAIARYEQTLPLLQQAGENDALAWLHADLAESYRYVDPVRASEHLDAAERVSRGSSDPLLPLAVRWLRVRLRGFQGQRVLAELRDCITALDALLPQERAQLEAMCRLNLPSRGLLAQWLAFLGRYDEAQTFAEAVFAANVPADIPVHRNELGGAYIALGLVLAGTGQPDNARTAFAAAREQFLANESPFMAASTLKWEIIEVALAYGADDLEERQRLLDEYARTMARMSSFVVFKGARPLVQVFGPALLEGRWDEVEESAQAYLPVPAWRVSALVALGCVERLRGNLEAAWDWVRDGLPGGPATEPGNLYFVDILALQRLAAELSLDALDVDGALAWIAAHERWLDWSGRELGRSASALLLARCHLVQGEAEQAEAEAIRALELASTPRQPLALLAAARFLGELAMQQGDLVEAREFLSQALALADACASTYERALTQISLARLRLAEHREAEASALLGAARATCAALQAQPALAQIARLLGDDQQDMQNELLGLLSPREMEVLRLVARGLSYVETGEALFISPRTVARHLQSIYGKLGLASRAEAAAFAYANGLV